MVLDTPGRDLVPHAGPARAGRAGQRGRREMPAPGPAVSVEGYVAGDYVTTVAITSKLLGPEPYVVEIGHLMPAGLPSAQREAVERCRERVIAAMGITMGAFHCEIRLPGGEPALIEPGAGAPGDQVVELVKYTTGISLPHMVAAAHVGKNLAAIMPTAPQAIPEDVSFV